MKFIRAICQVCGKSGHHYSGFLEGDYCKDCRFELLLKNAKLIGKGIAAIATVVILVLLFA